MMFSTLTAYIETLSADLPAERCAVLNPVADYIARKLLSGAPVRLVFICTHNSRRSHFGQVWAQVMAHYFGIGPVECFSGGTETTACNPRTVAALERAGIRAQRITEGENPIYLLQYADGTHPIAAFSKVYDHAPNPTSGFAAVMTCSQAEENCPFVAGAEKRFSLLYEDPKAADDTPEEAAVYDDRCQQIAAEMRYLFNHVNTLQIEGVKQKIRASRGTVTTSVPD